MRVLPGIFAVTLALAAPLGLAADGDPELDRKIEEAARASYNFRVLLEKQVDVHSESGVVTLTGTVRDVEQKALAEQTVRSLPGVNQVENELAVATPGRERGDGWLELKIRGILLLRSNVSARNTDVAVRDGVVTLTGVADNATQRELTAAFARNVEGVKAVRNELRVREGPQATLADSSRDAYAPPAGGPAE